MKLTKHVVITDCRIYFQCSELQPFWLSWGVEKDFGNKICRQSNDLLLCSAVMWQATTLVSNTVYGVKFKWHKLCIKYCLSAICDKISSFFTLSWQLKFFILVDYFMSSDGQAVSEKSELGTQNLFKSYLTEWNCLIVN